MESDVKCKCAKLERLSTGSEMTMSNSFCGKNLQTGLTFSQWELIVVKHFPDWKLVACANHFEGE